MMTRENYNIRKWMLLLLAMVLTVSLSACSESNKQAIEDAKTPKDIYILFTSDVHCGVDQGFGYAGLEQVRDTLEAQDNETILVDVGDAIQGETLGTMSKGETITDLMNAMEYDVAVPGNHEFDYGMDQFLSLTKKAKFPYICCNFRHEGKPVFEPYTILEVDDRKIAFVGVTTPRTITKSTPTYFQDETGKYVYDFLQDDNGEALYAAVQRAVDDARAQGADYVYVAGHLGMEADDTPWTYADVIEHTTGIDVFLDGHSHDSEKVVMKDKAGKDVVRVAAGTKLSAIGYSHITAEKGIEETGLWSWTNDTCVADLMGLQNDIREKVDKANSKLDKQLNAVIGNSRVELTINDPRETEETGEPLRTVRFAETNLGDFCADACRDQGQADIALVNGGSIRSNVAKGEVTFGNLIDVFPFGNHLVVLEATGQQILDALEWGSKCIPGEDGGFLQVSGLTYEVRSDIPSPCKRDADGMFKKIDGKRRVRNVKIEGKPLDPAGKYKVAGFNYTLMEKGDGFTMFDDAKLLEETETLDCQVLRDYITDTLGGAIGNDYSDPYGDGRIEIIE